MSCPICNMVEHQEEKDCLAWSVLCESEKNRFYSPGHGAKFRIIGDKQPILDHWKEVYNNSKDGSKISEHLEKAIKYHDDSEDNCNCCKEKAAAGSSIKNPEEKNPEEKNPEEEKKTEGNNCSICFEGLQKETNYSVLNCGHAFHTNCLFTWTLSQKNNIGKVTCPLCRDPFLKKKETHVAKTVTNDSGTGYNSGRYYTYSMPASVPRPPPIDTTETVYDSPFNDIPETPRVERSGITLEDLIEETVSVKEVCDEDEWWLEYNNTPCIECNDGESLYETWATNEEKKKISKMKTEKEKWEFIFKCGACDCRFHWDRNIPPKPEM